jgi:hypothetical protein
MRLVTSMTAGLWKICLICFDANATPAKESIQGLGDDNKWKVSPKVLKNSFVSFFDSAVTYNG